jgi:tetratricopeptide (TPR) repeat protein
VILLANPVHPDPDIPRKLLTLSETSDDDAGSEALRSAGVFLASDPANRPAVEASVTTLVHAGARFERRGDLWALAGACQNLSRSQARLGHFTEALATLDRAQSIYASLEDWRHVAVQATLRSYFLMATGRPDLAFEAYKTAIDCSRERGDRFMETLLLGMHSIEMVRYGNLDEARQLRERSMAITRDLAFTSNEPWNLWELGEVCRVAGSPVEARGYYEEARLKFQTLGDPFGLAFHRRGMGDLALAAGDFAAAADHFATAGDLWSELPSPFADQVYLANGCARALIGLGRPDEALVKIETALSMARRYILPTHYPLLLATAIELALSAGRADLTATWCGVLDVHPLTWNETRRQAEFLTARACAALGVEAAEALAARGRSLDAEALFAGLAAIAADETAKWLDAAARLTDSLFERQPA